MLIESGFFDEYEARADVQGPNEESGVLRAFTAALAEPARARKLVDGLLGSLRLAGLVGASVGGVDVDRLRCALGSAGWYLTMAISGPSPVSTSILVGREALDEQLERPRRSTADPGLFIGTAKDLLKAVAKFVL